MCLGWKAILLDIDCGWAWCAFWLWQHHTQYLISPQAWAVCCSGVCPDDQAHEWILVWLGIKLWLPFWWSCRFYIHLQLCGWGSCVDLMHCWCLWSHQGCHNTCISWVSVGACLGIPWYNLVRSWWLLAHHRLLQDQSRLHALVLMIPLPDHSLVHEWIIHVLIPWPQWFTETLLAMMNVHPCLRVLCRV